MRFHALFCLSFGASLLACSDPDTSAPSVVADAAADETDAVASDARPDYPPPPYGINVGDTFPLVTMRGRVGAASEFVDISSRDYYDPDGTRGIRAVFVVENTFCKLCADESPFMELPLFTASAYSSPPMAFGARGARFLDVIGHVSGGAVKDADVNGWITRFKSLHDVAIHAMPDPLAPDNELPHCFVVDPRSMRVVDHRKDALLCRTRTPSVIEALLVANGASPVDAGP